MDKDVHKDIHQISSTIVYEGVNNYFREHFQKTKLKLSQLLN